MLTDENEFRVSFAVIFAVLAATRLRPYLPERFGIHARRGILFIDGRSQNITPNLLISLNSEEFEASLASQP